MNLFHKQLLRAPVFTVLLAVLLAAAVAFSAIGFAAWSGAQAQLKQVDGEYTTIAVPLPDAFWTGLLYEDGKETPLTRQTQRTYPGLLAEDNRGFLVAHVEGCDSLSAYERGELRSSDFDLYGNSMAVLAVRCTSVTEYPTEIQRAIYDEDGNYAGLESYTERGYIAEFSLESVVCRLPAYAEVLPEPTTVLFGSSLYTADGTVPFAEGKTYLLFGTYEGSVVQPCFNDEGTFDYEFVEPEVLHFAVDGQHDSGSSAGRYNLLFSWEDVVEEGNVTYARLTEDSYPFYAAYEGDWQDFLNSEAGALWKDEIIPMCSLNYQSAGVLLTDNVNSLYLFNTGEASILEGRSFESAEYANGDEVCLVSAAYALKNNLSLGDTIRLDLYQGNLAYRMSSTRNPLQPGHQPVLVQSPCLPENRLGLEKDYTIVGIYTAPEFTFGRHNFQADTILVPKASVPNANAYEDSGNPLLYSIILKNGEEDAFEEYVASLGYGESFAYFNQNYNALADSLRVISANALRLLSVGVGAFVLTAALFLLLNFRRMKPAAQSMRRLGVKKKTVWAQEFGAMAALTALSVALGAALGAALYGVVTAQVLSETVALRPPALLACAGVQLVLLLLAAALWAWMVARRNPMQRGKET